MQKIAECGLGGSWITEKLDGTGGGVGFAFFHGRDGTS